MVVAAEHMLLYENMISLTSTLTSMEEQIPEQAHNTITGKCFLHGIEFSNPNRNNRDFGCIVMSPVFKGNLDILWRLVKDFFELWGRFELLQGAPI
jgi:hypothetical protein